MAGTTLGQVYNKAADERGAAQPFPVDSQKWWETPFGSNQPTDSSYNSHQNFKGPQVATVQPHPGAIANPVSVSSVPQFTPGTLGTSPVQAQAPSIKQSRQAKGK